MKIAAFIDEPVLFSTMNPEEKIMLYKRIKKESNADALAAVICGEFQQDGFMTKESKYQRAEYLKKYGVDLVVELPVYCILNTFDTYAFAAISTLEKLNCIDELIILCDGEKEKIETEIKNSLFSESGIYEENELNRHAVEYGKAIKRIYSTMKVHFLSVNLDQEKKNSSQSEENKRLFENALWTELKKKIENIKEPEREQYLNEISGGYLPKTKKILEIYKMNGTFDSLIENLKLNKNTTEDFRRYMLRALVGIRQVEISICGLYSYALYVNIFSNEKKNIINVNNHLLDMVNKKSWIPIILKNDVMKSGQNNKKDKLDDSRKMLLLIEKNAELLYQRLVNL